MRAKIIGDRNGVMRCIVIDPDEVQENFTPVRSGWTTGGSILVMPGEWHMDWEGLNEATLPATRTYEYDALGRRNREPYNKELYYDAFGKIIEEREPFEVTQYVWGVTGGNHLILRDRDTDGDRDTRDRPTESTLPAGIEERIYAVTDAAGNVTAITDRAVAVPERYTYTPEGKLRIVSAIMSTELATNQKNWLYTYQGGPRDGAHLYYLARRICGYRTAENIVPNPMAYWGIQMDLTPRPTYDFDAGFSSFLPGALALGIYDQVKASVELATDRIGWDEWTERMAVGGAFQMAVAPSLRGASRAASRPAYTTETVLPARGWRGFGEINSFGRGATFVADTSTGVSTMSLSAAGRFGCYIGVRAALAEDLVGVGRLGGQLYHARRLGVLRRYLERRGFSLSMDDAILDALNANGGFSARSRTIYLRSDATRYEVWHELSHFLHSRRIGSEAYLALQRPIRPEAYVYDSLRSSRHWHLLNSAEQRHASAYIMKVGGMAW